MPSPLRDTDPRELGDYRIVGRLGRGGMGTVFLGEDSTGRRAAVKVINTELAEEDAFRARFRREVTAARSVRRFCTAAVLDARLDGEPLYVATEYVDGPTLDERVNGHGPLDGGSLESLAVGMATALVAIHDAGLVHRDLKPSNVLLSPTGPRVIDFGIARALDAVDGPTRTGQFVGTPAYIAPEILRGGEVTQAADVFAWGCVIAYAGTGSPPFAAATVPAIMQRVLAGEPALDGLDPGLRDLVVATLDKDPARRPSAHDLLARLTGRAPVPPAPPAPMTVPVPAATRQDSVPEPTQVARPPRRRRKPLIAAGAGAGALVLALAVTVYVLTTGGGPPENTRSVFGDDFSDQESGWGGSIYLSGTMLGYGYKPEGAYGLDASGTKPSDLRMAPTKKDEMPAAVLVSVSVTVSQGPPQGMYGLICREQYGDQGASGYRFLVRHDGQGAQIRRATKDRGSKVLLRTGKVNGFKPQGANRVQVACEPDGAKVRLRLWMNGELAAETTDADRPLGKGNVGIITVQESGSGETRAVYDDFDLAEIRG
ncbi:serine/threonine-protein kinase [Actinomadura viridis]|uniref:serine/threonine-protein kinase n=1 Tax=Actinomadura viridis TaxID=58110 RepID=UPI0036ADF30A